MKIINLFKESRIYTSNVYLVLGSWNAMPDVNTVVDVGCDPNMISELDEINTGVGKKRLDSVVLTHSHFDHISMLPEIKKNYDPHVYAYSPFLQLVDTKLMDGDKIKMGDAMFEVIHCPGHSIDSILLYCEQERVLFCGDVNLVLQNYSGTHDDNYINALSLLSQKDIDIIYPGHGPPIKYDCNSKIRNSLLWCENPNVPSLRIDK